MRVLLIAIGFLSLYVLPLQKAVAFEWHHDKIQGFEKFWIEAANDSRFTIWCNRARKRSGTVIQVEIGGQDAPPKSSIHLVVDRQMITVPTDEHGYVLTDCVSCADAFIVLWNRLRSGGRLQVKFSDQRYIAFSLEGARDILRLNSCRADLYK